jgi:hypothetical protein
MTVNISNSIYFTYISSLFLHTLCDFTRQSMQTILILYVSHARKNSPLIHRLRDIYVPNNANNFIRFEQVQSLAGLLSNTEILAK